MQRQAWVMQHHSWSRVPHNLFGLFSHVGAVAVDGAFSAGALLLLERAFIQPEESVIQKFGAFGAEFAFCAVFFLTVVSHHYVDGFLFAQNPRLLLTLGSQICHDHLEWGRRSNHP